MLSAFLQKRASLCRTIIGVRSSEFTSSLGKNETVAPRGLLAERPFWKSSMLASGTADDEQRS